MKIILDMGNNDLSFNNLTEIRDLLQKSITTPVWLIIDEGSGKVPCDFEIKPFVVIDKD